MSKHDDLNWLSVLDENELLEIINNPERSLFVSSLRDADPAETIDRLGYKLLPVAINGNVMYAFWPEYWQQLKNEFKIFICTSDKKYVDLRKKLSIYAKKSQTAIVSTIAAAMAAQFGVLAGVLIPFVAMCLVVLARTGKEAFCATLEWNMPLNPSAKSQPKQG